MLTFGKSAQVRVVDGDFYKLLRGCLQLSLTSTAGTYWLTMDLVDASQVCTRSFISQFAMTKRLWSICRLSMLICVLSKHVINVDLIIIIKQTFPDRVSCLKR